MIVITEKDLIKTVCERWKDTYGARWYNNPENRKHLEIYERLKRLKNPTSDEIAAIIGNRSWTTLQCDECEQDVLKVVELGQEPDFESRTVHLCQYCLQKAIDNIKES